MGATRDQVCWRRSSRCEAVSCVEVGIAEEEVLLRQSRDPDGPVLAFTRPVWAAFLEAIRAGEIAGTDLR
jgi:hypothetical protein